MWRRRYPHVLAGRIAAIPFTLAGLAAGWIAAIVIPGSPPPYVCAILWAAFAGAVALLVFSSESAPRPPSVVQASIADGLVTGAIASGSSALVQILASGGAGSAPSPGASVGAIAAAAGVGALAGSVVGAGVYLVGGQELLKRDSGRIARAKRGRKGGSRQRRK